MAAWYNFKGNCLGYKNKIKINKTLLDRYNVSFCYEKENNQKSNFVFI